MSRQVVRVYVDGRVQGVGFRAFLIREGAALGLDGWARNRSDGSVEAVAAGSADALAAFLEAARKGPCAARVDRLLQAPAQESDLAGVEGFTMAPSL